MQNGNVHMITLVLAVALNTTAGTCISAVAPSPREQRADTMDYFPYLAADGRYGYVDKHLNMVISPTFRSAMSGFMWIGKPNRNTGNKATKHRNGPMWAITGSNE